jgi:LysM repeat protein
MDTISSRENNNILPLVGVIVGGLALVLSAYALVKLSSVNATLKAQEEKVLKIDQIESQANAAAAAADKANTDIRKLKDSTQDAVTQLGNMVGEVRGNLTKIEEQLKKPAPVKGGKGGAPAVAGPDEYIVQKGDGGAAIARKNRVSLSDLQSVNPGVNWTKLSVGQKVKLPSKKAQ